MSDTCKDCRYWYHESKSFEERYQEVAGAGETQSQPPSRSVRVSAEPETAAPRWVVFPSRRSSGVVWGVPAMTPERERMFREQMHAPTDSLDVHMWQIAIAEVFAALDVLREEHATYYRALVTIANGVISDSSGNSWAHGSWTAQTRAAGIAVDALHKEATDE